MDGENKEFNQLTKEEKFNLLVAFYQTKERWPERSKYSTTEEKVLSRFFQSIRAETTSITVNQHDKLIELDPNFFENQILVKLNKKFNLLVAFYQTNGRWPSSGQDSTPEEKELAIYCSNIRAGRVSITAEQKDQLLQLNSNFFENQILVKLNKKFNLLVNFYDKEKRWPIITRSEEKALAVFCHNIRKRMISITENSSKQLIDQNDKLIELDPDFFENQRIICKIEYKNKEYSINSFSKEYSIPWSFVKRNLDAGKNIETILLQYKAVQRSKQRINDKTLEEILAKCLHLSEKQIEEVIKISVPKGSISLPKSEGLEYEGQSLYQYCINNHYNYGVIYYDITQHNISVARAVARYKEYGQELPTFWIYEDEIGLLKHQLLNLGIDSNKIVSYVKKTGCSLDEAIIKEVIDKKAHRDEKDYLYEVYTYFPEEIDTGEVVEAEFVDNAGLDILQKARACEMEIAAMDISSCVNTWNASDLKGILDAYGIKDEEIIKRIFFEYPIRFEDGILNQNRVSDSKVDFVNKWGSNWDSLKNENYIIMCEQKRLTEQERLMIEKNAHKYEDVINLFKEDSRYRNSK